MSATPMYETAPTTADLAAYVAAEIRAEMGRQRISNVALGRMLGTDDSNVSRRLNGRTDIDLRFVQDVCRVLGIEPLRLFSVRLDPQPPRRPPVPSRVKRGKLRDFAYSSTRARSGKFPAAQVAA